MVGVITAILMVGGLFKSLKETPPSAETKPAIKSIQPSAAEAVTSFGKENEHIKFRVLSAAKVLSIYHKGAYENIGEAYAFLMEYAEKNGYEIAGLARESYIDGIWNKDSVSDWLTEVQLPIK